MKKIICLALCALLLLPTLASCAKPPEYAEIEERFQALVAASAEINQIFFGTGLPTYPRVEDLRSKTKTYINKETGKSYYYYTFTDESVGEILAYLPYVETKIYEDTEGGYKYFYREIVDDFYGKVIAVDCVEDSSRDVSLQILTEPKEGEEPYYTNTEKGYYGYVLEGYTYKIPTEYRYLVKTSALRNSKEAPAYRNDEKGEYYYLLAEYEDPTLKFSSFYEESDPEGYEYVRSDSKYLSVQDMKSAAEQVYSTEYLNAIYEMLFVGTVGVTESVSGATARYMEYAAEDGTVTLMKSTTYKPLVTETRVFDFSTAKIVRPANNKYVTISVESYLPSKPTERLTVRVGMILQDGTWMLDSATY